MNVPDIIFEDTWTIDLANKKCIIEKIKSTHTENSTIIYIPEDKAIFLGDCAYGTTTDSLFHFKKSSLIPMINDISKYDTELFLLGHESVCNLDEINLYWKELTATNSVVMSTKLKNAEDKFQKEY